MESWTAGPGEALRSHHAKCSHFTGVEIEYKGALNYTGLMAHSLCPFHSTRSSSTTPALAQNSPDHILCAPDSLLAMTGVKYSGKILTGALSL